MTALDEVLAAYALADEIVGKDDLLEKAGKELERLRDIEISARRFVAISYERNFALGDIKLAIQEDNLNDGGVK